MNLKNKWVHVALKYGIIDSIQNNASTFSVY